MKYLNDTPEVPKVAMRGDAIVAPDGQGGAVVGTIHELYDRDGTIRVSGYPLRLKAATALLALDAYKAACDTLKRPTSEAAAVTGAPGEAPKPPGEVTETTGTATP